MTSRARAYPTTESGAAFFLRGVARWLQQDIDGSTNPYHTMSPFELLGKVEALATVTLAMESILAKLRREGDARLKESIAKIAKAKREGDWLV